MILDDPKVRAAHLLRRAGFGAPPALVAKLAAMPYAKAVAMLLTFPAQTAPAGGILAQLEANKGDTGLAVRAWWYDLMLKTRNPLQEKLTLFWHGHFATSDYEIDDYAMYNQNQFFRRNALGSFRTLLEGITLDPAMLQWLDGLDNVKDHPNENYAREVMELFTLGRVDPVSGAANYTEEDVRAGGKIFTGWTVDYDDHHNRLGTKLSFNAYDHYGSDGSTQPYTYLGVTDPFINTAKGSKKIGDAAYKQAVDAILNRRTTQSADQPPSCARWIAYKMWKFFGYPLNTNADGTLAGDDAALVDRLATAFYGGGAYSVKALVQAIFTAPEFVSDRAYRAIYKSPVEIFIGMLRELGATYVPKDYNHNFDVYYPAAMGQDIFAPPNVKGWDGGRKWISAATLFDHFNFGEIVSQRDTDRQEKIDFLAPMRKVTTINAALDYYCSLLRDGQVSDAERARLLAYLTDSASGGSADLNPSTYAKNDTVRKKLQGLVHLLTATPTYQMN